MLPICKCKSSDYLKWGRMRDLATLLLDKYELKSWRQRCPNAVLKKRCTSLCMAFKTLKSEVKTSTGSLPCVFIALCNIPSQANSPHSSGYSTASSAGCENLCDRALHTPSPPRRFLQDSSTRSRDRPQHPHPHPSIDFLWRSCEFYSFD